MKTKPYTLYLMVTNGGFASYKIPITVSIPDNGIVIDEYDFDALRAAEIADHMAATERLSTKLSDVIE